MEFRGMMLGLGAMLLAGAAAAQERVAVITPYLAQPGTQFYIDGFEAARRSLAGRST
jgi:ribose transport system substrate-binding protein